VAGFWVPLCDDLQRAEFIVKMYLIACYGFSISKSFCQNLLGKSCVLPTSKKLCKVKKRNSSPTVWHNSLAKSRSNLHQESWEKQNYVCALPPLEKLASGILLYYLFLFHPPT
jgi:hypothetical protein